MSYAMCVLPQWRYRDSSSPIFNLEILGVRIDFEYILYNYIH